MAEGTSEIEEHRIVLTENAARRIAVLRDQEQAENAFLRITVSAVDARGSSTALLSTSSGTRTTLYLSETVLPSLSTMSRSVY
jgi:Fe-S cluster assembly iron-binding protein IscA